MKTSTIQKLDSFTLAYIEAALCYTNDELNDNGGDPLGKHYGINDISDETLDIIKRDCELFQYACAGYIKRVYYSHSGCSVDVLAGHDLFLTRNHAGAGYWDGDWSDEVESLLAEAAHAFGEFNLYVGDDGKIYNE